MKTKNKMLARLVAACAFLLALTLPCAASDIQNPSPATAATTPGGAANSIQFNNGGAFGGFGSWNGTTFTVPGAANSLNFAGSSTTNPVTITATGSDAGVGIQITPKGSTGYVAIGLPNAAAITNGQIGNGTALVITGDATTSPSAGITVAGLESSGGSYVFQASSSGTLAAPAALSADKGLGVFTFWGYGDTAYQQGGGFIVTSDAIFSDTSAPAHIEFFTTPIGSTTPETRLKISNAGIVNIVALTSNGFVKTSGGDGTLSVQTGGVTASGATCTITAITGGIITAGSCL